MFGNYSTAGVVPVWGYDLQIQELRAQVLEAGLEVRFAASQLPSTQNSKLKYGPQRLAQEYLKGIPSGI